MCRLVQRDGPDAAGVGAPVLPQHGSGFADHHGAGLVGSVTLSALCAALPLSVCCAPCGPFAALVPTLPWLGCAELACRLLVFSPFALPPWRTFFLFGSSLNPVICFVFVDSFCAATAYNWLWTIRGSGEMAV